MSRTMARFSSSVVRSACSTCRTSDLATSVTTGARESSRARTCGSSCDPHAGLAGGAERDQHGVPQLQLAGRRAGEELGVLGHRARPAALDEAHADLVQQPRHGELVGDGVA